MKNYIQKKLINNNLFFITLFVIINLGSFSQINLTQKGTDGIYRLTESGASYFANLSLQCAEKPSPHYYERYKEHYEIEDSTTSKDLWPSFYGCYDWHSSVHNHWCLIKLLKKHPTIPEAKQIRERLNESFSTENIKYEAFFLSQNEEGYFEFPYGQSWFLKLADELKSWNDLDAKRWLKQIEPLLIVIEENHLKYWNATPNVKISGSHDSPAIGISFALDYSRSFKKKKLEKTLISAANKYYLNVKNAPISSEPVEYDFMSGTLLIADLMRKVLPKKKYANWLSTFTPELVDEKRVHLALKINKIEVHDGFESHWDGFHLNRIWCLNGMLISLPKNTLSPMLKSEWINSMNEMWDYAQISIGKGNYDIDHWLSSFSVFALEGYK
jgi:hypothetical protein